MKNSHSVSVDIKAADSLLIEKKLPTIPYYARVSNWFGWRRGRHNIFTWWAWEITAACFSIAAMIAQIAVLAEADKHESQTWAIGSTQLTLNTIIAVVGTVQRATLAVALAGALNQHAWNWFASKKNTDKKTSRALRDLEIFSEASAHMWSCLRLLWRTKGRYLVSLGALVMVLIILFDAFLQQLISIDNQPRKIALSGSNLSAANMLPHATSFDQGFDATTFDVDTRVQALMARGAFDNDPELPTANCPTGQCEWPGTPSLAICSACEDIAIQKVVTSNDTCSSIVTWSLPIDPKSTAVELREITLSQCGSMQSYSWNLDYSPADSRYGGLAELYSYGVYTNMTIGPKVEDQPVFAYRCNFTFCVNGYSATLSQGQTQSQVYPQLTTKANTIPDAANKSRYWLVFEDLPQPWNSLISAPFNVSSDIVNVLSNPFRAALSKHESFVTYTYLGDYAGILNPPSFWVASSSSYDTLSAHAAGIATSLSTWLRTSFPAKGALNTKFAPNVTLQVPVVHIRWVWLLYPLALQFAGLLFLAITMWVTTHRQVKPWKGHRIPLLLARLDPGIQDEASGGLASRTGLDDRVGAIQVKMHFDGEDGISFRRA